MILEQKSGEAEIPSVNCVTFQETAKSVFCLNNTKICIPENAVQKKNPVVERYIFAYHYEMEGEILEKKG